MEPDPKNPLALEAARLDRIRVICTALPEVEETTWQERPLFRVRRRRFAIVNDASCPPRPRWAKAGPSLHLLTDPLETDALRADRRFQPSPHHRDQGWVALRLDTGEVDWDEIAELLQSAYLAAAPKDLAAGCGVQPKSRRTVRP